MQVGKTLRSVSYLKYLIMLCLILQVYGRTPGYSVPDLTEMANLWKVETDTLGSTATIKTDSGTISSSFKQVAGPANGSDGEEWPWVQLDLSLPGAISKCDSVKVVYKSSNEMWFTFNQDNIEQAEAGASFFAPQPTAADWSTAGINLVSPDLVQPDWVVGSYTFDKTQVSKLLFVPVIDASGGDATIDVQEIYLYGYDGVTKIIHPGFNGDAKSVVISILKPGMVNAIVPYKGTYSVSLYSVRGVLISAVNRQLAAGKNEIRYSNGNLAKGVYVVQVGNKVMKTMKSVIAQ